MAAAHAREAAEAADKPWRLHLICCGKEDGSYDCATRGEAELFRSTYTDPATGHDRQAILIGPPNGSDTEPGAILVKYLAALAGNSAYAPIAADMQSLLRAVLNRLEQLERALADVDMTFRLPDGGGWCATCRLPMREGRTVVKTLAVVCEPCATDLAATAGRLDPTRLAARKNAELAAREERGAEPEDTCRYVTVDVDGDGNETVVRVQGSEEMSKQGRAALAEIVAATKRRFEAEAPTRCGDAAPVGICDHAHVCTKQPHDDDWHADGSGARWRWDRVATVRHGRSDHVELATRERRGDRADQTEEDGRG